MIPTKPCFAVLGLLGTACTFQPAPVPVSGDTRSLEGEWTGTFSSERSGRSGSIVFRLTAGADSAYGDVVMLPSRGSASNPAGLAQADLPTPGRLLRISFIRCEGSQVTGRLDPYEDPETGEQVFTTFEGSLRGDVFRGTFSSYYAVRKTSLLGTWSVKRQPAR